MSVLHYNWNTNNLFVKVATVNNIEVKHETSKEMIKGVRQDVQMGEDVAYDQFILQ